jgi:hypothetical protein
VNSSISTFESEKITAKHFVWVFFLFFLAFLSVVGGINLVVDPSNQFGLTLRQEKNLSNVLLSGKAAIVEENLNIHAVRRNLLDGLKDPPEALVFGSSRTWDVTQKMFGDRRFLNAGTNSATIDDYVALWGLFESGRPKPKLVLLGADPWIFNRANLPLTHCMKLASEFKVAARALGGISVDRCLGSPRYRELFSLNRLMTSVRYLQFRHSGPKCVICIVSTKQDMPARGDFWHVDGSLNHFHSLPPAPVAEAARSQGMTSPRFKFFEGMDEINARLVTDWRNLLRLIESRGTKIVIYLSPFHPAYIAGIASHLPKDIKLLKDVEARIRNVASDLGISVIGSYMPKSVQCGIDEYYDAIHIKPSCIARILSGSLLVEDKLSNDRARPLHGMGRSNTSEGRN